MQILDMYNIKRIPVSRAGAAAPQVKSIAGRDKSTTCYDKIYHANIIFNTSIFNEIKIKIKSVLNAH